MPGPTTTPPGLLPFPSPADPTTSDASPTTKSPSPTTTAPPAPTTTAATPTSTASTPTTTPATTSPATTPTSSSTSAITSSTSASQIVATSNGQGVTITSFVTAPSTSTPTPQNHSSSNSFFSNKGAVAGVFTVVGLIVVAFVIALIINAIRRRRAEKFDRDVAEAAAEAAMSSRSPFDEYGGNGGGGYGYSENNHGVYRQPTLPLRDNGYGMSEMAQYDPYAAAPPTLSAAAIGRASSRNESPSAVSGIAGVGSGNLTREPSKRAPYHAFAGPSPPPQELWGNTMRSSRGDMLEAAGLVDTGAAAMAGNNNYNNEAFLARKPSELTQNTHHSGRSRGNGSTSNHPAMLQPGYPVDSSYPQRIDTHSPDMFLGYQPAPSGLPNPHDMVLPSPSVPGHSDHSDYHETGSPTALRSDEQRMNYQDDADYGQGSRVLRVANE